MSMAQLDIYERYFRFRYSLCGLKEACGEVKNVSLMSRTEWDGQ